MKYVVIQPYFGKFPVWMDLFLYSCSKNPQVDFVFYTDCVTTSAQQKYPNITFCLISFQDYCSIVSERLGIDFKPQNSYKLCDLKPFLGLVHQEVIESYDCWGYCDIDLVLGDLSILLDRMNEYDFISTHADRASGHFTMIKTRSKFTKACLRIRRWREKLTIQKHKCLDERDLTIIVNGPMYYRNAVYNRFLKSYFSFLKRPFYKLTDSLLAIFQDRKTDFHEYYTTPIPDYLSKYIYDTKSGKMMDVVHHRELPYLHFLFFKKTQYWDDSDYWTDNSYHFLPGETFLDCKGVVITKKGLFGLD